MTYSTIQIIRSVILVATFVTLEFAAPVTVHVAKANTADVLVAKRTPFATLLTCPEIQRTPLVVEPPKPVWAIQKSLRMTITAYSSTPDQTSGDPFITANGSRVHWGTFAVNGLPFGTKLRIPEYYGDQVFIVEDRMSSRYSSSRGDIWMETRNEAKQWGVRNVHVEIVQEQ